MLSAYFSSALCAHPYLLPAPRCPKERNKRQRPGNVSPRFFLLRRSPFSLSLRTPEFFSSRNKLIALRSMSECYCGSSLSVFSWRLPKCPSAWLTGDGVVRNALGGVRTLVFPCCFKTLGVRFFSGEISELFVSATSSAFLSCLSVSLPFSVYRTAVFVFSTFLLRVPGEKAYACL